MKNFTHGVVGGALLLLGASSLAWAAPFDEYSTQSGYQLHLPAATTSYFTAFASFRADTTTVVDGYSLRGKILAAANSSLYLQNNFGSSRYLTVATVPENMDPSFLVLSPSGSKIALGAGFYKPLYILPPSTLSVTTPPDLSVTSGVKKFDANYYDAAWRDDRYLFVNAGAEDGGSVVYAIDTELEHPEAGFIPIIEAIPGASAGITFDHDGNLITGIGYGLDTGQLKIWGADDVADALAGASLPYEETGHLLAEEVLSAASLGVDGQGNLHVGGGDVFGTTGNYGFAALISKDVLTRVLEGGAPMDRESSADLREIAPDPCKNDDAVSVRYIASVDMLVVSQNLATLPPDCDPLEWSGGGGERGPGIQLYFPEGAPDSDNDGIPDGADNAYLIPNPDQTDADGDGFGDVVDFDFDGNGIVDAGDLSLLVDAWGASAADENFDARFDFDRDGDVDDGDVNTFLARWGTSEPFY